MTAALDPEITAGLVRMFAANQERRASRANTAFELLRPCERRIVREAAVMGYVLGHQAGRLDAQLSQAEIRAAWPKDFAVLQNVLEHCDSTSDLYPYLAAACDGRRRRVTKARQWPGEEASG